MKGNIMLATKMSTVLGVGNSCQFTFFRPDTNLALDCEEQIEVKVYALTMKQYVRIRSEGVYSHDSRGCGMTQKVPQPRYVARHVMVHIAFQPM
jgi:hypothetical protein